MVEYKSTIPWTWSQRGNRDHRHPTHYFDSSNVALKHYRLAENPLPFDMRGNSLTSDSQLTCIGLVALKKE